MPRQKTELEEQTAKRQKLKEKELFVSVGNLDDFPASEVYQLSSEGIERLLNHIQDGIENHERACPIDLIDSILSTLKYKVYSSRSYAAYKKALDMSERAAWLRREVLRTQNWEREREAYAAVMKDMQPGKNWAMLNYVALRTAMEQSMVDHERKYRH